MNLVKFGSHGTHLPNAENGASPNRI